MAREIQYADEHVQRKIVRGNFLKMGEITDFLILKKEELKNFDYHITILWSEEDVATISDGITSGTSVDDGKIYLQIFGKNKHIPRCIMKMLEKEVEL